MAVTLGLHSIFSLHSRPSSTSLTSVRKSKVDSQKRAFVSWENKEQAMALVKKAVKECAW